MAHVYRTTKVRLSTFRNLPFGARFYLTPQSRILLAPLSGKLALPGPTARTVSGPYIKVGRRFRLATDINPYIDMEPTAVTAIDDVSVAVVEVPPPVLTEAR